jgi:NADPH-dependent glutamate synthase beta subunit-like oxidoreductase
LSNRIELEGARREGVLWGLDFLRDFSLNQKTKVKDRVAVIGGGNVALVVALTALRLGAKEVQIACLESEDKMPAFQDEIRQAVDEGVRINASWGPKRILVDGGKVAGIELVRCVSVFDGAGRFSPSFNEQEKKMINADMIILAIGQVPDLSLIPKGMKISQDSTIQINPITLETNLPGIFAGGDVATKGSSTSVVEAIAAGRRASVSIDRYLKGEDLKAGRFMKPDRVKKPPREGIQNMARQQTPELPVSQRGANFKEVKIGFNEDRAHLEAQRCMTCGSRAVIKYVEDCQLCLYCERDCPQKAIYVSPEKKEEPLLAWG